MYVPRRKLCRVGRRTVQVNCGEAAGVKEVVWHFIAWRTAGREQLVRIVRRSHRRAAVVSLRVHYEETRSHKFNASAAN